MKQFICPTNAKAPETNIVKRQKVAGWQHAGWQDVRITVLSDRLFRVEQSSDGGGFTDKATQVVWFRNFGEVNYSVTETPDSLIIRTDACSLIWNGTQANSFIVFNGSDEKIALDNAENLLGTYRTLDRCDGSMCRLPAPFCSEQVYPVYLRPGILARNGVSVLDDSISLLLEDDGLIKPRTAPEEDIYIFAFGHQYRAALKAYFDLCGPAPLIPRYAFGNWWSRYYNYTEKTYLHLMDSFKAQRLPFTVATIDMGWHWSTTVDEEKHITELGKNDEYHGFNNGWTGYSWNTHFFPDYKRFLKELKKRGLHITVNLHPSEGVRWWEDCYREFAEAMGVNPDSEKWIKFDMTDPLFIQNYFDILHHPMEDAGVDFWWIDWQQGTVSRVPGLDPLWMLNHYHYLDNSARHLSQKDAPDSGLILSRFAGNGSHRYPLGFTGDTYVTWDSLKFIPYFTATASNIGFTWWSHDIGGHMRGYKDDELYVRYIQFGVFSPINRLHSTDYQLLTKEPRFYMNGSGLIAGEFLRLRHRMIPFLHSASYNTTRDGLALIEPLYYEWPEAPEAYQYGNTYLFGQQLLCVPITSHSVTEGMAEAETWLPAGVWTDIFTGEEYYVPAGGRIAKLVRYLDSFPVLLREGGFFVLDNRGLTNDCSLPDSLEVMCACGTGSYILHEEIAPGKAPNGSNADCSIADCGIADCSIADCSIADCNVADTRFSSFGSDGLQRIRIETSAGSPARRILLRFVNIDEGKASVTANGSPIDFTSDDNGRLTVEFDLTPETAYEIAVSYTPSAFAHRMNQIADTITRLMMTIAEKQQWDKIVFARTADPIAVPTAYPDGSALPEIIADRFREVTLFF